MAVVDLSCRQCLARDNKRDSMPNLLPTSLVMAAFRAQDERGIEISLHIGEPRIASK